MNAKKMNHLLINTFPELIVSYHDEVDWQEGDETGSHVVYGDVFMPYVEKVINEEKHDDMKRIFKFIEDVLLLNEEYSDEVIMFSVLERLIYSDYFEKCERWFGRYTREVVDGVFLK